MAVAAEVSGSVPPQNEEAEVAVLGTVLMAEQALDQILVDLHLSAEDFYRPRHQLIFRAMVRLKQKAEPEAIDAITVCDDLKREGKLEEAGGQSYVHSLPTLVPSVHAVRDYAKIVRDHSILRKLLASAREIQEKVMTDGGDPRALVEQAEQAIFRAGHDEDSSQLQVDRGGPARRARQARAPLQGGHLAHRHALGLQRPRRDHRRLPARQPDRAGGQAGDGQVRLATNIAENAAVDHGKAVALFSLEMSEGELAQRFIASRGKIKGESLRKGRVKSEQWPKVLAATEKLTKAPLFVDDSSDLGVLELRAKARRLHNRHPLGLLIIDYLQLMRAEDPRDGRVEQVGKMSRGLKILARELNIPVIAISQLSRAVEARPDKRPLMSDLRESGNIEQDADLVMFVYRDEYYNNEDSEKPGVAEVIIGKHRNGPVGKVELTFLDRYPKFVSIARDRDDRCDAGAGAEVLRSVPDRPRAEGGAAVPARHLRRQRLDPARRRHRRAVRLPRADDRAGDQPRHGHRHPQALPRGLVRPQADRRPRPDGAAHRAHLRRSRSRRTSTRAGLWFAGDVGTGKTSLAMLVSLAAERAGARWRSTRSPACWPRSRTPTTPRAATPTWACSGASARWTCCSSTTSARRSARSGCSSSSTRWSTSAGRTSARSWSPPTSWNMDELREQLGARTVSRLTEICGEPIPIMGPDLRVTAGG